MKIRYSAEARRALDDARARDLLRDSPPVRYVEVDNGWPFPVLVTEELAQGLYRLDGGESE